MIDQRSGKHTIGRLATTYVVTLVIISVAAVSGYFLVQKMLEEQANLYPVLDQAGIQRVLTAKITKDAIDSQTTSDPVGASRARGSLRRDMMLLRNGFRQLVAFENSVYVRWILRDQAENEDRLELVTNRIAKDGGTPADLRDVEHFTGAIGSGMTLVVKEYSLQAQGKTRRAQTVISGLLILLIGLLAAESVLIFRPAFLNLKRSFTELQRMNQSVAEQGKLLEQQNEELQDDRAKLQDGTLRLEAANIRIEAAAKRFEELFQGLPIACFGYDRSGMIYEWNRACEQMFGLAPSDLFVKSVYDLMGRSMIDDELTDRITRAFSGEFQDQFEFVRTAQDGTVKYLLCCTIPIHGQNQGVSGAIFSCVDITAQKVYENQIEDQLTKINDYSTEIEQRKYELEEANRRLESLAMTDGLTGLKNHRAFQEALATESKRAKRDGSPLSVVMIDVDHFKQFNDTYGHPAGDQVLRTLAGVLLECARETDCVARYGGEEFVLLLPDTDGPSGFRAAERIRQKICALDWPMRVVTASFGVAQLLGDDGPQDVLGEADSALYRAKENGRNRVHLAERSRDEAA